MHVEEFRRMNANIKIEGRSVIINGPANYKVQKLLQQILRAGAALIIAGFAADGYTRVTELKHIDRGYVNFHGKLAALGADIERVKVEEKSEESSTTTSIAMN